MAQKFSEKPKIEPSDLNTNLNTQTIDVVETAQLQLKQQRSRWKRFGTGAIAGIVLVSGLATVAIRRSTTDRSNTLDSSIVTSALPVEVVRVDLVNSYEVSQSYTGEIEAPRTSNLSFERSGLVVSLFVNEGDSIEAGTPIAQLDTSRLDSQRLELIAQKAQATARLQELEAGPRTEDIATAQAVLAQETAILQELQAGPRRETIDTARANVRNIEERLQLAQLQANRRERLYRGGAVSREQFDEATTAADALQAELNAARRQLDELLTGTRVEQIDAQAARVDAARSQLDELLTGTRIEQIDAQAAIVQQIDAQIASLDIERRKSSIDAPFSGTVSVRYLDEGTVVGEGESIVRLVENTRPEVRVGVPTDVAAMLNVGERHRVNVGDRTYSADIRSILPEVDAATRTQTVILQLETPAAIEIAPGVVARLELTQTQSIEGFWLPTAALVRADRGLWACYVPIEAETPASESVYRIERRVVEVIHEQGDRVFVRGTLQSGEVVVSNGTQRLVPGQLVALNF
ncbi:MAG: efflux RND transporter periplasmic adaptor subunit [Cyanobacteria bacterium SBC]|nr:efflux RND transporter periplasmic adaptor subunit [Cyanobacteria bacterium SBC]